MAGTRLNELSLCHIWLPALKRFRLSPRGISRSSVSTFDRFEISREVARLTGDGADGGLERAEALAERDLLFIGERLTPEKQHRVIVERARDLAKHGLVDPSNVDAGDLHAER